MSNKLERFGFSCHNERMDDRMEAAHVRAGAKASKVFQAFFVLFVIAVIAALALKIVNHTDGVLITEDAGNDACWTSSKDIINKNNQVKAVKCKESATKQSSAPGSSNLKKNKTNKTSVQK